MKTIVFFFITVPTLLYNFYILETCHVFFELLLRSIKYHFPHVSKCRFSWTIAVKLLIDARPELFGLGHWHAHFLRILSVSRFRCYHCFLPFRKGQTELIYQEDGIRKSKRTFHIFLSERLQQTQQFFLLSTPDMPQILPGWCRVEVHC